MTERVIAIDGPAGSGKSTTARAVAARLAFAHLDSGALYRAVTLAALEGGAPMEDEALVALAERAPVTLDWDGAAYRPVVAGRDVSEAVRSDPVTAAVSSVAARPGVRAWATRMLRRAAAQHPRGVVADGRDIGTVVFPGAGVKVFLTASGLERAKRRARETGRDTSAEGLSRLSDELARRDRADSQRDVAPLARAADAVEIDTTTLRFEQQVEMVVGLARKAFS